MALKDFNFKQFMLQKGEWVGLGFALAIMLPVFGIGMMKVLTSPRPTSKAQHLDDLSRAADERIDKARPPEDADKKPKEFFTNVTFGRVDPDAYSTPTDWFIASGIEDTRRRSPEILPLADLHIDYVLGGMKGHIIDRAGKRVMVIQKRAVVLARDKKTKRNYKIKDQLSGANSFGSGRGMMPGGPGVGGERGYGPTAPGGGAGGISMPSTAWQDIDKVGTGQNVSLAEDIYPVRMAVVTGTFPFRQQMDEFRRALKKPTLDELFAMFTNEEASWKFAGFRIQRHVLYPDGREKTPWQDYEDKVNSAFATLFAEAVDYERDDPEFYKYEGILNRGLVMVRPQLERGQYPKIEIQSIKDALAVLDKQSLGEEIKRPLSDLAKKLQRKGVDPYDPLNPFLPDEEEDANKTMQEKLNQQTEGPDKKSEKKDTDAESEQLIPDKALVRFIDVTVEPGLVYEYRIKVRMANPNYNQKSNLAYKDLGKNKEIEASDWTLLPRLAVPHDIYYYAIDEKPDREKVNVQIHRWVDNLLKDPQNPKTSTPLGDWTIAEQLPVRRGEYIGRIFQTKVPLWNIEKEDFELGVNPKNKQEHKIPVDYAVRTSRALDPALLVDYQGGKDVQDRLEFRTPENKVRSTLAIDSVPVQMLILTPEGKLVVRNQQDDNSDEERIARHKAWKDWIADVESGRRKPKPEESPLDKFRGGGTNN